MSDNLQNAKQVPEHAALSFSGVRVMDGDWASLPDHQVIELAGADALKFAQSQFMNDVLAINAGHWQWNGWLNPKGRVRALFALLVIDAQTVWLLLADVPAGEFVASLERFCFRSKVTIRHRDDIRAFARFRASTRASGNHWTGDTEDGIDLDWSGSDASCTGRSMRLTSKSDATILTGAGQADTMERWAMLDLAHGMPRLDASQREQWTPQQLSLDRLSAYSVKKGCYPGQEIVARTHYLGQAKRGLVLLETEQPLTTGAELSQDDRSLGSVISTTGRVALAVLPLELSSESPMYSYGNACWPKPFVDGLRR